MEPESVLQSLLSLWDELPGLVGPDWVELYPQLEDLVIRLQQSEDAGERASLCADLVVMFQDHPQARNRLREMLQEMARERGATQRLDEKGFTQVRAPGWSDLVSGLGLLVNPPVVTGYTDITAPKTLRLGRRGVITVGLTRSPSADSEQAQPLEVQLKRFLEVYLDSRPQDFEVIGERVRRLPVEPDTETQPAVYYIKGLSLGTKNLLLDFRQYGSTIGTVQLVIEVTKETLPEEQLQQLAAAVTAGGPYAPPVDLDITVTTEAKDGQITLNYMLHSPSQVCEYHYTAVPGKTLPFPGSLVQYQEHQILKIEALAKGKDVDGVDLTPEQVERKLQAIGHLLYEELFSKEMRSCYRQFRGRISTLQITSDEPWMPWELIRPYDASDPDDPIDDDFLCVQFQMSRWLAGEGQGAGKIEVRQLACVEAGQALSKKPLKYAPAEREYLANLAAGCGGVQDAIPKPATGSAVESLLDAGGTHLWHFAAHGNVDLVNPNESVIRLADKAGLRTSPARAKPTSPATGH